MNELENGAQQNGSAAARSELIEEHVGLVYGLVKRFLGRGTERDELVQSGFVGLARAAASFDASRGSAFSSYAFKFIEGAMRECIRSERLIRMPRIEYENRVLDEEERIQTAFASELLKRPLSIDSFSCGGEENFAKFESLAAYSGFEDDCIKNAYIREMLNRLEPIEKNIVILRFFVEKTQKEAAKLLKISQSRVSKCEKAALIKLRTLIESCERIAHTYSVPRQNKSRE